MNTAIRDAFLIFCLIWVILFLSPVFASQQKDDFDKPLIIALREDFPPFSFFDVDGKPVGIFVDIWKLWSAKTGRKIEFLLTSRTNTIESVKEGKAHIVGNLTPFDYRKEWLEFSDVLYEYSSGIYSISKYKDISDLKGLKVGVVKDTYEDYHIKSLLPYSTIYGYDTIEEMISATKQKKIDAFCANSTVVEHFLTKKGYAGQFYIVDKNLMFRELRAGVLKGNHDIIDLINNGFGFISFQDLSQIEENWIPDPSLRYFYKIKKKIHLTNEEQQWITQNPVVKIGFLAYFLPFSYLDANGNPTGLAKEYMDIIEKATGLRFEIVASGYFSDIKPLIDSGEVLVVPFAIKLPERTHLFSFSKSYFKLDWAVITKENHPPIKSLQDLRGLNIGVLGNSAVSERFSKDTSLKLIFYNTQIDLWTALSDGKIDAVIQNIGTASYYIFQLGLKNLKVAYTLPEQYDVAFGIAKGQPHLLNIINKVLDSISPEEHRSIIDNWTKTILAKGIDWKKILRWAGFVAFLFSTILIISLVWNNRLKKEIEKRKVAQALLETEKQKLQTLIENAPIGIVIIDRDLNIIRFNSQAERYICNGKNENHKYGAIFCCVNSLKDERGCGYSEECHKCPLKKAVKNLFENEQSSEGIEMQIFKLNKPEEACWIRFNISKIVFDEQTYAIISVDDITQHKIAEKQLLIAKDIAEKATKAKSEFLSSMSHEIRTPLNALINMNLLLLETRLDDTQKEFVNTAVKSSELLLALVNDILDFSKIEAGRLELEHKPLAISDALMSVIMVSRPKAEGKDLYLTYEIEKDANIVVYGDFLRLQQILLNLVSNGIKFTHSGGVHVKVSCINKDDYVANILFTVSDTGIGIESNKVDKIFEAFSQAESSTTRRYGGTGLGLTISKRLVEMMGGDISVKSMVGQGSTFYFNIPFEIVRHIAEKPDTAKQVEIPKGLKILLVEDNLLNQTVIKGMIRNSDVSLDIANNGLEAIKKAQEMVYDLILMDIKMPEMDGVDTTRHIRNLPKPNSDVPIIAITSHTESQKVETFLQSGMNGFLPKPVEKNRLFVVINSMIQSPQNNKTTD